MREQATWHPTCPPLTLHRRSWGQMSASLTFPCPSKPPWRDVKQFLDPHYLSFRPPLERGSCAAAQGFLHDT
jgi:hypothetical protein